MRLFCSGDGLEAGLSRMEDGLFHLLITDFKTICILGAGKTRGLFLSREKIEQIEKCEVAV
jgi:hypothetical protein